MGKPKRPKQTARTATRVPRVPRMPRAKVTARTPEELTALAASMREYAASLDEWADWLTAHPDLGDPESVSRGLLMQAATWGALDALEKVAPGF